MNVLSLSSLVPMEVEYPLDSNIVLTNDITNYFYGLNIYSTKLFNYARDFSVNYYNTFVLTDKLDKKDFLTFVTPVSVQYPKKFSTTLQNLALSAYGKGFWVDYTYSTTDSFSLSCNESVFSTGDIYNLGSWNMYEIELLDETRCTISKIRPVPPYLVSGNQQKQYLTADLSNDYNFLEFVSVNSNPPEFNYIFNKNNNTIIFYKNYNPNNDPDQNSLFIVSQEQDKIVLKSVSEQVITNTGLYNLSAVFIVTYRDADKRIGDFTTNYNAYKQTFYPTAETSYVDSVSGLKNNYLVSSNVEFVDNTFKVNFQPLKNQLDLNYNFTINNNFSGSKFDNRDYQSIETGTNQELGFPDIVLTFYTYNAPLTLKKGALTYFHFPVSATPFLSLNVNDTKLVDNGAFAGQNPLDADKIFKKLLPKVDNTDIINQQTGTYLCTWLYASAFDSKPVWLDRYYNPNFLSIQSSFLNSAFFTTITTLSSQNITYFDKISDLVFEPNATYSYYRISEKDLARINATVEEKQINSNIINVFDLNNNLLNQNLNNITLENTNGLSQQVISAYGDFSLAFNLKSSDYTKKIGNSLISNIKTDTGLNVSNIRELNNLILFTSAGSLLVCDYDFNLIRPFDVILDKNTLRTPDTILSIDFNNILDGYVVTSLTGLSSNLVYNSTLSSFVSLSGSSTFYISLLDKNFTTLNTLQVTALTGGMYNFVNSNIDEEYYYGLYNNLNTSNVLSNNQKYFLVKYPLSGFAISDPVSKYITNLNLICNQSFEANSNPVFNYNISGFNYNYNFSLSSGDINYYLTDYKNNSLCTDKYGRAWYIFNNIVYHIVDGIGDLSGYNYVYKKNEDNIDCITNITTDNFGNVYIIADTNSNTEFYKLNNNRELVYSTTLTSSYGLSAAKYVDIIYKNEDGVIEPYPYVVYDNYELSSLSATSFKQVIVYNSEGKVHLIKNLDFETDTVLTNRINRQGLRRSFSNTEQINKNYDLNLNYLYFDFYIQDIAGDKEKITLKAEISQLTNDNLYFTFTFNALSGNVKLYINSILVDEADTTNVKYEKQIVLGDIYINTYNYLPISLKDIFFNSKGLEVSDLKAFNKTLTNYDIRNLYIRNNRLRDLVWNVPSGKRNITETIQQNFKFSLPDYKTNIFDIIISGAKGLNDDMKAAVSAKVREFIKGNIPINTIVNDINIRVNE